VGRSNIGSPYIEPFRIIPRFIKIGEDPMKPLAREISDVLHKRKTGSKLCNNSNELEPETGSLAHLKPSLAATNGNILARKPSSQIPVPIRQPSLVYVTNVPQRYSIREPFLENCLSVRLYLRKIMLGKSPTSHESPERPAANTGKQLNKIPVFTHYASSWHSPLQEYQQ
jgi:hypothetical protein